MPPVSRPTRRRVTLRAALQPMRQGHLDGLCGLYAIVNAVRAVCPTLTAAQCEALFKHVSRTLHRDIRRPRNLITDGIPLSLLWRLVVAAQRFLAVKFGVRVCAHRLPRRARTTQDLGTIWRTLAHELRGGAVAIIGIGGAAAHWTVVVHVQKRQLQLLDSDGLRLLRRSSCDNRPWAGRYRLLPQDVIVVSGRRVF